MKTEIENESIIYTDRPQARGKNIRSHRFTDEMLARETGFIS